jgi:hypothetical protein
MLNYSPIACSQNFTLSIVCKQLGGAACPSPGLIAHVISEMRVLHNTKCFPEYLICEFTQISFRRAFRRLIFDENLSNLMTKTIYAFRSSPDYGVCLHLQTSCFSACALSQRLSKGSQSSTCDRRTSVQEELAHDFVRRVFSRY